MARSDLLLSFRRLHAVSARAAGRSFEVALQEGEPWEFPEARNMAYCSQDDNTGDMKIVVAPKLVRANSDRIEGVLRHEFGHALLLFSGHKHGERDADLLAEKVFGDPIFYDRIAVQTLRGGIRPRPASLGV